MRRRLALLVALLASLAVASPPAFAQAACQLSGGFAQLQAQVPDRVGSCQGDVSSRPELGQADPCASRAHDGRPRPAW